MAKTPLFQARHYKFLAQFLFEQPELHDGAHHYIIERLSEALKRDNPNFSADKFEAACSCGTLTARQRPTVRGRNKRPIGQTRGLKHFLPESTYGQFLPQTHKGHGGGD